MYVNFSKVLEASQFSKNWRKKSNSSQFLCQEKNIQPVKVNQRQNKFQNRVKNDLKCFYFLILLIFVVK
jgi:hypothetical protein